MAIADAGFLLNDEQKEHYKDIQVWLTLIYHPQLEKVIKDLVDAKREFRRLKDHEVFLWSRILYFEANLK
jgi:hypothetical protein